MLPKQHRLRQRTDVQSVRRSGRAVKHPLAIFLVAPSSIMDGQFTEKGVMMGCPPSRFAFVASRRVGSAVQRNRAKRLMREAVRLQMNKIQSGWDGIFIARQETVDSTLPEIIDAVENLFSRAKILQKNHE